MSSTPKSSKDIIAGSLAQTLSQLRGVVSPFIQEVQRLLEEMVESMHAENFSG